MNSINTSKLIKLSYFIISTILLLVFTKPDLHAQSGFAKAIPINANVDIDDIVFHNNQLILRGNIGIESLGLWGLLVVGLDTNGLILWQSILYDTLLESSIISNTPSRFLVSDDKRLILPVNYYNTGQLAIYFTDMEGKKDMHQFYDYGDGLILPFDINQINNDFYLSGVISYPGGDLSLFVLKLKQNGDKVWIKYFGLSSQFEISADAYVNDDQTLTLYADRFDADFLVSEAEEGWKKPWIFTIDTSGAIIEEWIGEKNDSRTLGGEFFTRLKNGDYILQSTHYKKVPGQFGDVVKASPTITRLDNNFNQIWKLNLTDYENRFDRIFDMGFDTISNHIVVTGDKLVSIEDTKEYFNWTIQIDTSGQILWNNTDSIYFSRQNGTYTAGLDISPSGSIYVGGYVTVDELDPRSQAFVIKYTSDGCSDTICTTTSIEEQIRNWGQNITVFPNPAADEVNIGIKSMDGVGELNVFDFQGGTLYTDKVYQGNNLISTSDFPAGIYFYSISSKSGIINSGKFTIVR